MSIYTKNHCKQHGINNCSECNNREAAHTQFFKHDRDTELIQRIAELESQLKQTMKDWAVDADYKREVILKLEAELVEAKLKPPVFIKNDPSTEQLETQRAFIDTFKSLQKDNLELQEYLHHTRVELVEAKSELHGYKDAYNTALSERNAAYQELTTTKASLKEAVEILDMYANLDYQLPFEFSKKDERNCIAVGNFVSDDFECIDDKTYLGVFHGKRAREFLAKVKGSEK